MKQLFCGVFTLFVLMGCCINVCGQISMNIEQASGTTSYSLYDINKLMFSDDNMVVNLNDETTQTFALSDISQINYSSDADPVTSIEDESTEQDNIVLYPLPVNESLNVEFESSFNGNVTIQIVNMRGSVVLTLQENVIEGVNNISLNVAALNKGFYLFLLKNNSEMITRKIVKQ